jgi:hypothetical protein
MMIKRTIAVIGEPGEWTALADKLAGAFRLLFVSKQSQEFETLTDKILNEFASAEIEYLQCSHEACWEADIILLLNTKHVDKEFADKINDVATQKVIVVVNSHTFPAEQDDTLRTWQRLLPYSKIAVISYQNGKSSMLKGTDEEAIIIARELYGLMEL